MLRKEAIKELQESLDTLREYDIAHSSRLKQALELAIQSLEQEPCDDAVSREAVIEAITNTSGIRGDALNALYALPSVNPQPCDDAISREDALEALNTINGTAELDKAFEVIENLPPVTQKGDVKNV